MEYHLDYREEFDEIDSLAYVFDILLEGEYYRAVKVSVTRTLFVIVGGILGLEDRWAAPGTLEFRRGIFRLAVRRIENDLQAGLIEPAKGSELYEIVLASGDEPTQLIADLGRGDKMCSHQARAADRNLYCLVPASADKTATMVHDDGRRVAPTSRALCSRCELPDTDYICSLFLHPEVVGVNSDAGIVRRALSGGLCDIGSDQFSHMGRCRPEGNSCWKRIIVIDPPPVAELTADAVRRALDDLDVRWRVSFGLPVVRPPDDATAETFLDLPCATQSDFEKQLSVLSDYIARLDVPEDLFPKGTEVPEKSLGRLDELVDLRTVEPDLTIGRQAIGTLRKLHQLRGAIQHGDSKGKAKVAMSLAIPMDGSWLLASQRVRGLAARALRDLGDVVRRVAP